MGVDLHPAPLVCGEADGVETQAGGVRASAHGQQHPVALDRLAALGLHCAAALGGFHAGDAHAKVHAQALLLEDPLGALAHLLVHPGQGSVGVLQHGDLGAQARPHRAELQADDAGADDHQVLGHRGPREGLGGAADAIAVDLNPRQGRDLAAGGDDHVLRAQLGDRAVFGRDRHAVPLLCGLEAAGAVETGDLVLLKQEADALGEVADDAIFAGHHLREVELDALEVDAVLRQRALGLVVSLAALKQRLARDAPDPKAGAAEARLFLDAGGLQTELSGADRAT